MVLYPIGKRLPQLLALDRTKIEGAILKKVWPEAERFIVSVGGIAGREKILSPASFF